MPFSRFPISRRTLLRGAGTSLALPWLEAMMPARALASSREPQRPVRLAVLYMPNGVNTSAWAPKGTGREFEFSPTLEPLAAFKDQLLVLHGLWNQAAKGGDGHYVKEASILTCTTISKTLGEDLNIHGVSMDQMAARHAARETPLPSLELGISSVSTGVDTNVGYTRVYGSHIAWSGPQTPLAREINPRAVYQRMFRAWSPQGPREKRDALLLDHVLGSASELRKQLGAADRARMDEYLSVVRSLEQRLERAAAPRLHAARPDAALAASTAPPESPGGHAEHVRLMLDMIALAFHTDTTRVATFMMGNAVSGISFRFLEGVTTTHHETSHHQNEADKLRQYQLINRWHVEQYAYLLGKLREMREGEGNVLDNSMVMFASALSDGNRHDPHDLPVVVAGGGGGRLARGQKLVYTRDTPLSNLYVSMLDAFGAPVQRFADSTGPLAGVLA